MSLDDKLQNEKGNTVEENTTTQIPTIDYNSRSNDQKIFSKYNLTEDKIDYQIIPVIKVLGIFTSIVWLLSEITQKPLWGIICLFLGLGITYLWMSIFEGFSSIIKLLRKISNK